LYQEEEGAAYDVRKTANNLMQRHLKKMTQNKYYFVYQETGERNYFDVGSKV
jgi:hypothetical protein